MVYITEKFGKQNKTASKPNHFNYNFPIQINFNFHSTDSISISIQINVNFDFKLIQFYIHLQLIQFQFISIWSLIFQKHPFITLNKIIHQYSSLNPNFKYDSIPSSISKYYFYITFT